MVIVCLITIVAGVAILDGDGNRRQIREMEHRERLAMIDRGLILAGARPEQFERRTGVGSAASDVSAARFRTQGVIMIGCGLALAVIIGFAGGAPRVGVGIGGGSPCSARRFCSTAKRWRVSPLTRDPASPPRRFRASSSRSIVRPIDSLSRKASTHAHYSSRSPALPLFGEGLSFAWHPNGTFPGKVHENTLILRGIRVAF
jgi:hypothetical protein